MDDKESPKEKFVSMQIGEAHERLHRLEVRDRRHWAAMIAVLLSIAVALYSFTLPDVADSILSGKPLRYAVRSLLVLVLLFAIRALREQRRMAQQRRELASELAVIAASETLQIAMRNGGAAIERRATPRTPCEQRLSVTVQGSHGSQHYYGRMIDIGEHGIGAIVPCVLSPEQQVLLEFSLDDEELVEAAAFIKKSKPLKASAIVCQRSGFRYGFNFVSISEADQAQIRAFYRNENVIDIATESADQSDSAR